MTSIDEAAELSPCPFCGGSASLSAWDVQCDTCGALVVPASGDQHEAGAIAAWNHRSAIASRQAVVTDEMVEAVATEFARYHLARFLPDWTEVPQAMADGVIDAFKIPSRAALNSALAVPVRDETRPTPQLSDDWLRHNRMRWSADFDTAIMDAMDGVALIDELLAYRGLSIPDSPRDHVLVKCANGHNNWMERGDRDGWRIQEAYCATCKAPLHRAAS